jgi:hypothetical protein
MDTGIKLKNTCDNMELTFLSDPGHGWLRVPHKLLEDWDIDILISEYSYRTSAFAYLEEDCDASIFINEANKRGFKFSTKYIITKDFDLYLKSMGNYYRFNNNLRTA